MHVQGDTRPDMTCCVEDLLAAAGEENLPGKLADAVRDIVRKFKGGLPQLYYQTVPYIPIYCAAGTVVKFGMVMATGRVSVSHDPCPCPSHHRDACMLL